MSAGRCRVLFVSNGHGEIAIATRIAQELPAAAGTCDHLALVGNIPVQGDRLRDVGPRRAMPSGGLVAMGNVRNLARDVQGGLLVHTLAQLRFLKTKRGSYDVVVAVGDVYALLMALQARAPKTVFTGTAKSVYVARYGAFEQRAIARADAVFVRDEATARTLRDAGIAAHAANVIVDLHAPAQEPLAREFGRTIAIFPGSRHAAYRDAVRLCAIAGRLARDDNDLGALLSIAPGLDAEHMRRELRDAGWDVREGNAPNRPFLLFRYGRPVVHAWAGPFEAMLAGAAIVLGQAGTANEAAAAAGIPVVAYESGERAQWYRKRQIGLLGDALLVVRGSVEKAARDVAQLIADPQRRSRMGDAGRERMGRAGGAALVAAEIARLCD
jgi:uncharacterized protein (TIGR03492 family)